MKKRVVLFIFLTFLSGCFGSNDPFRGRMTDWDSYVRSGEKAYKEGRYRDAERTFEAALKEARAFGKENESYLYTEDYLANVYGMLGKYALAESIEKKVLDYQEKKNGADHPSVATALNNLAATYRSEGKYTEAETLLRRAKSIIDRIPEPKPLLLGLVLANLAGVRGNLEDPVGAETLYIEALDFRRERLGKEHAEYGGTLVQIAGFYMGLGKYKEAFWF